MLWILDSKYWIVNSLSVELGLGTNSKAQDSGFNKQEFLRFQNPAYLKLGVNWLCQEMHRVNAIKLFLECLTLLTLRSKFKFPFVAPIDFLQK